MSYCPPSTPSKTPTAKRRNSLPNGESLGLRMEHGRLGEVSKHAYTNTHSTECVSKCTKGIQCTYIVHFLRVLLAGIDMHIQGAVTEEVESLVNKVHVHINIAYAKLFMFNLECFFLLCLYLGHVS